MNSHLRISGVVIREKEVPMYGIKEPQPGVLEIWHSINGELVARLDGGNALTIGLTYVNLQKQDDRRAQDFLHGVVLGMTHIVLTGAIPVVRHEGIRHATE